VIRGSCLCGDVAWQVDGAVELMSHCHCSRCRKTHGAAFATYVLGAKERFRFVRGRERIVHGQSPPGSFRTFCGRCGSPVPYLEEGPRVGIPAGCLDDDPGVRPLAHIFVASKAPWWEIRDALPRFDAYPPGFGGATLPDRAAPEPPGGAPRGSCLCSGVAYRVEGKPTVARNCHCGRCRKARGAAHASNLVTSADGVRFTRGAELLAEYKVPEARFFTHVFCRACGSSLPRIDRGRNLAVVPMGSLDDDPGIRPSMHIFVGSKAPWYEIPDDLPQHAEYPPGM
jgi:hypothetical protein